MNAELAYRHCERLTRERADNFFYGICLLPPDKRRAMCAVYAFARGVDDVGDGDLPREQKLRLLKRARASLDCIGEQSADPVIVALGDACSRFPLKRDAFRDLIDGIETDIRETHHESFDDLVLYCRRVAGSIGRLCLGIFGASDMRRAEQFADDLGVALQLTNILRDVKEDRALGRVYLPAEDLRRFGCGEDPLTAEAKALEALILFEAARCRDWLARGLQLLPLLDRRSAACVYAMAGIYSRILARIEERPAEVRLRRISLPIWEKAAVAARSLAVGASLYGRVGEGVLNGRSNAGLLNGGRSTGVLNGRGNAVAVTRTAVHGSVVVVGGGLAGISAALACADAGARVTLLEVRPRLGGAAYSFERDGLWVDNGQHVFLRCCTEYRKLLERLGTAGDAPVQRRLEIPVLAPGGRVGRLARSGLPAPLHLAGALSRYRFLTPLERLRAARAALALDRLDPANEALDRRTFGQWLAEHGQSRGAVDALWNLIALPTLNLQAEEASLALATFVFQTGLLRDAAAGDVGWARVPLSELHGDAAERVLRAAGVDLRLRWRAERTEPSADGGFEVCGPGGAVSADAVVVAVPHDRAASLLPEEALAKGYEQLTALGTSPIVNVHVVYDRRVTELPFAAGVDTPVQWVFDRTRPSGLRCGQYLAVSLSGANREIALDSDRLRELYLPALADLLPRARSAHVERFFVTRDHAATFRAAPGVTALRPGPRTGIPGLVLAGAWTDTAWPATMEGAVRSGQAAAREALGSLGRARDTVEVAA